jgi:hypothetical protein
MANNPKAKTPPKERIRTAKGNAPNDPHVPGAGRINPQPNHVPSKTGIEKKRKVGGSGAGGVNITRLLYKEPGRVARQSRDKFRDIYHYENYKSAMTQKRSEIYQAVILNPTKQILWRSVPVTRDRLEFLRELQNNFNATAHSQPYPLKDALCRIRELSPDTNADDLATETLLALQTSPPIL